MEENKRKKIDRIGEKFNINNEIVEIVEYFGNINCSIKFEDGTILKNVTYQNLNLCRVKNPNKKIIFNIGFIGQGKYISTHPGYKIWHSMLRRCYDKKYHLIKPTYIDCTVDERWHNFQVFAEWYENNYINEFDLDKDILFNGNMIYSPETCCFVPNEINIIFQSSKSYRGNEPIGVRKLPSGNYQSYISFDKNIIGLGTYKTVEEAFNVYKIEKQNRIKEKANKWKDKLLDNVYQKLINYEIKIND